jgi:hypothetical protein
MTDFCTKTSGVEGGCDDSHITVKMMEICEKEQSI